MIGIIAENAERCGAENEMRAFPYRQSNPSRGEDAAKLAVRKKSDLSVQLSKICDEPVGTAGDLSRRFTSRATIAEDTPVGVLLADVDGAPTFVIAIVPFGEVGFDFNALTQANQRTRPLGPPTWTAEHMNEFGAAQSLSKLSRLLFAVFRQRDIGAARVLMGERPGGLPVPNEIEV